MLFGRLTIYLVISLSSIERSKSLTTSNPKSGLYIDNGEDQTMIHELTTENEKMALEHEILKLLGLPDKPISADGKAPLMKRSAPNFLLDVYENTLDEETKRKLNVTGNEKRDFYLKEADLRTINESDSIVTFSAQQKHQGIGGKPDRVKRIWFDVSAVPEDERMISAELRLYRGPEAKNRKSRGSFAITVYRVLRTENGERGMLLVDSVNTTAGQEGWLSLNVTESLNHWKKYPLDNKGFYLSVHPIDRSSRETRPEDIGIVGFKGDAERQPFMAGFFESNGLNQLRIRDQPNLQDLPINSIHNRKRDTSDIRDLLKNHYTGKFHRSSIQSCRINTLYVSFKDLQWQDWIIAPEGYDAFYCGGECKFPLNSRMNATNHAIVQTLMHLNRPSEIPKPCCAPTKLSTISVLYFHDDNNVVLRKYKNMAVRGCGCH